MTSVCRREEEEEEQRERLASHSYPERGRPGDFNVLRSIGDTGVRGTGEPAKTVREGGRVKFSALKLTSDQTCTALSHYCAMRAFSLTKPT